MAERIRAIERCVEGILDASDGATRVAVFLDAAQELCGAHAAALCRPLGGGWARIACDGDPSALPTPDEVAAVAGGVLAPWVPPCRAVLVAHAGLALALAGVAEDADGLDEVAGLLALYAAVADLDPGPAGLDEVPAPRASARPARRPAHEASDAGSTDAADPGLNAP